MKRLLIRYIHSINSGWIYSLRVRHGVFHEWIWGKRIDLLSKFIKNKRKLVVATAFSGKKYADNPRYIIEKIHELSPDTEIVWIKTANSKAHYPEYVRVADLDRRNEIAHEIANAKIIIGNNAYFDNLHLQTDQLHIQTWHGGLGFKKIGKDPSTINRVEKRYSIQAYDFWLSDSDHLTRVYRSAFGYNGPVWKCGYPIEDVLCIAGNVKKKCHAHYHIPEETHIVLYAPTFRSTHRWRCKIHAELVLEALQKRFGGNWQMLVHWHQNTCTEERILTGAIDVTDTENMQELAQSADAFISDYSSSIFQAVQCHIPCFVYADDYEEYDLKRGLYYPLDEQPFPYALTEDALIDNILHYDAALWEEKWQHYQVRMGHVVTGHSAEDVAKVCVDFLNGKPKSDIMKEIPFETRF